MGKILGSKRNENKIIFEVELSYDEATVLKGHFDGVHLITDRSADLRTDISSRGKDSVTKYFLIPRQFRLNVDYKAPVSCQKIETCEKIMFVYVVDKGKKNH